MTRTRKTVAAVVVAAVALLGARRLAIQGHALLVSEVFPTAGDFKLRFHETNLLFDGQDVYREAGADYPPASYAVLWPFVRPWTLPTARALWLAASIASIAALSLLFHAAVPGPPLVRALATLLPWAASPSAITIGLGQLGLVTLAATLGAVSLSHRRRPGGYLALAAVLMVVGLAKPSLSAPLCLAALTTPSGAIAALGGATLYSAATAFSCSFQPVALFACTSAWIHNGVGFTGWGYGNLATWSRELGHPEGTLPLAALCMVLGGAWLWRARASDPWTQLGVLAALARLWTYHYVVDDVLTYVPLIALLRQTAGMRPRRAWAWSAPAVLAGFALLLPTRWRDVGAWPTVGTALNTGVLLALLVALLILEQLRRRDGTLATMRP